MQVWIVTQAKDPWELGGIFSTEDLARQACTEPGDRYWPVTVDQFLGRETTEMTGIMPFGPRLRGGDALAKRIARTVLLSRRRYH